jgi:hypothetical protein
MKFSPNIRLRFAAAAAAALVSVGLPATAEAQLFLNDPNFRNAPIEGSDPLVGVPIPGATPAEQRAHLLWNLRSGLNVAALQCQFSPYLRTVGNYNAFLAHHSAELATAYTALTGYFRRVHGAQGMRLFDDYSTVTYNNFSAGYAQMGFCQTAAAIVKEALRRPKGSLNDLARDRMRMLRSSLTPVHNIYAVYQPNALLRPTGQAFILPDCTQIRNRRERRDCERANAA